MNTKENITQWKQQRKNLSKLLFVMTCWNDFIYIFSFHNFFKFYQKITFSPKNMNWPFLDADEVSLSASAPSSIIEWFTPLSRRLSN